MPGVGVLDTVDLAELSAHVGARLRAAGIPVTAERAGRFAASITLAAPGSLSELYWLARITLLSEQSQLDAFGRVFLQLFKGIVDPAEFRGDALGEPVRGERKRAHRPEPPPDTAGRTSASESPAPAWAGRREGGEDAGDTEAREATLAARSAEERLRQRDFADLTDEELTQLRLFSLALAHATPSRVSRRRIADRDGREFDVRATLRRSRRTGGEPLVRGRRSRRRKPRRLVLVCDISGSMEPYARAYVQLLVSGRTARSEIFVFATRLTRLTRALRNLQPAAAIERAGRLAPDWSGGTRIGATMKAFNDDWGRRGLARGAVVVVLSDGWDTGDPAVLSREMERLRRLAYGVIWVNPRKASPGYAPLAGGMAAALPYVDAFVSGHSRAALDEVLKAISSC